jgi:hypothetical protein
MSSSDLGAAPQLALSKLNANAERVGRMIRRLREIISLVLQSSGHSGRR